MNIAVIGAGTIGRAIIESLLKSDLVATIYATRRRIEKIKDLELNSVFITKDNKLAAKNSDVVILSVKPLDVLSVLDEIQEYIKGKLVISLVAAIPIGSLKQKAPEAKFVRAMPNIAVLVQESFTAYATDGSLTEEDSLLVQMIFGSLGMYIEVEEKYLDAFTGLTGSGPAYMFTIIEAFMYAGLKVGLPRELALYSAAQLAIGAGKMVLQLKKHPAELKDMVVTPGGTTIEGIYMMEDNRVRTALIKAVVAATEKSKIITEQLKNNE